MDDTLRRALLRYARSIVRDELLGTNTAESPSIPAEQRFGGAFVTLKNGGRLRGCMGTFQPGPTLPDTIASAARLACRDPRFTGHPIGLNELSELEIEVSVLTPPRRAENPEQVEIGRHGVLIRRGAASGCFLPQVAAERGWTREEFLSNCCAHKAHLPENAWREADTEISVFTADVFSDRSLA